MIKIFRLFSVSVLVLAFLCLFAASIRHVTLEKNKLGIFTESLKVFSAFPSMIKMVLTSNEVKGIPPTFLNKDTTLREINNLDYNVYGLNSFYNEDDKLWNIKLFNFKDDSVIHTWNLYRKNYLKTGERKFDNSRPRNPILLPNRSLIVLCAESNNLYRLDKNSNVIWHNTQKNFHHSINFSSDSNIWVCTSGERRFRQDNPSHLFSIRDDFVTKVNIKTGEIIFDKSVCDILIENGYKNFVYGFSNHGEADGEIDPIHLNDIEPVFEDGPFWKKGDLFLSSRHKSFVILYRPSSNEIIWMLYGPFLHQHDVDIISDHEISIFNNNATGIGREIEEDEITPVQEIQDELIYSKILVYNFEDSTYRTYLKDKFINENLYSWCEGLCHYLTTGDVYVESQNDGIVYIMNNDRILLKKQFQTSRYNKVHMPNWVRIYENIDF